MTSLGLPVGARKRLMAAVVLGAAASGCGVALLGVAGWLLSRAAEEPPVLHLMVAIVAVRTFGLGKGLLRYLERLVGHDLALRRQADLRLEAWQALIRSTWVGRRSGDLLSRVVNDVESVQDLVVRVLVPFAAAGLVATATVTVLATLSPGSAAVLASSVLLAGVGCPWLAVRLSERAAASLAALRGELASVVAEVAETAPELVAYGAGEASVARVAEVDARLRRAERRTAWASGLATAGQTLAAGVAVLGGLLVGAVQVSTGLLAPVNLAVLVLTPLALHEVLSALPAAALSWRRAAAALSRVQELLDAPSVGTPDALALVGPAAEPELRLTALSAGWPDSPAAVTGLDLTVSAGQRVALVGPSGSGKTTVAATVLGLLPPVAGTVAVRGRLGHLAQDAYVFDSSVAENVRIGRRDASDADIAAALDRVRLDLPLDRMVGAGGCAVSGGEARRLAMARLLIGSADVLVLDEPTEHLDAPTASALIDDLWRVSDRSAVLVITHDPELAARCDRVVSLPGGTIPPTISAMPAAPAGAAGPV